MLTNFIGEEFSYRFLVTGSCFIDFDGLQHVAILLPASQVLGL